MRLQQLCVWGAPLRTAGPPSWPSVTHGMALLSAEQQAEVERIRQGPRPKKWRARFRYEHLTRESQMMVARTVTIDADLRNEAVPQVVILGAGLDGRAWRMRELVRALVFEVDHPDSQQQKRQRVAHSRWRLVKSASCPSISGTAIWRKRWKLQVIIPSCRQPGSGRAS